MKNLVLRCIGAIFLIILAPACGSSEQVASDKPVDRDSVAMAFRNEGEPLTIRLDMAVADPGSAVDVIFVPEADDVPEPPYQVTVFETVEAAEEQERTLDATDPEGTEVARAQNVVVTISPSIDESRRDRILAAMDAV